MSIKKIQKSLGKNEAPDCPRRAVLRIKHQIEQPKKREKWEEKHPGREK
jgi:hypothetical protein